MDSQERSVAELIRAAKGEKDGRRKYPFDYWERYDFQLYCKRHKMVNRSTKARKWVNWYVVYEHYRREKMRGPKKFRMIIAPKTFLAMMRFFFIAADKKRLRFKIKTKAKLGIINVKEAYKKNTIYKLKKTQPKPKNDQEGNSGSG